jgi:hypothetical protein
MVWGAAMTDDTVLDVALSIERELGRPAPGGGR